MWLKRFSASWLYRKIRLPLTCPTAYGIMCSLCLAMLNARVFRVHPVWSCLRGANVHQFAGFDCARDWGGSCRGSECYATAHYDMHNMRIVSFIYRGPVQNI